jgi:hypothetical protein
MIPFRRHDVEQHFKRKHWCDFAGYREAKPTKLNVIG